jgi:hypothetical protein
MKFLIVFGDRPSDPAGRPKDWMRRKVASCSL